MVVKSKTFSSFRKSKTHKITECWCRLLQSRNICLLRFLLACLTCLHQYYFINQDDLPRVAGCLVSEPPQSCRVGLSAGWKSRFHIGLRCKTSVSMLLQKSPCPQKCPQSHPRWSCTPCRPATRGKQGGKGRRAAKWLKRDTTAGCCAFGALTFLFFFCSSYTSDEASLATDLLVLCHGGHLPPPSGHWDREQNLSGFFCSIQ